MISRFCSGRLLEMSGQHTHRFERIFAVVLACLAVFWPDSVALSATKKPEVERPTSWPSFGPYPPMVHPVRIGIGTRASAARIAVWAPGWVFVDNRPLMQLKPQVIYQVSPGRITELATGRSVALPLDKRTQIAARDAMGTYAVWANNRWWRGSLELILTRGVTTINLLDLEDYLQGVVPSEMPASWQLEALKAQAVAARSYAVAHLGKGSKWLGSEGFDLVPDVRDQAYKGLAAEAQSTRIAVYQTQGIILRDAGKIKPGFYRATVGDYYENLNIRTKAVPKATLEKLTGVPGIVGVTVKRWDSNLNAHTMQVMGKKGAKEVYGIALAKMLGLSTPGILDVKEDGSNWVFTCRGPGNGARGLSQHGANSLAKNGWRYEQILQHYYQDNDGQLRLSFIDQSSYAAAAAAAAARYRVPFMRHKQAAQPEPAQEEEESDKDKDE
ncbi:MAG: hypothetical protein C0507_09030 [Cyanobacteria bacterium PR.3.49]|nr:hypothetical protein [Cyanobacteria bacterium PR.3.49]